MTEACQGQSPFLPASRASPARLPATPLARSPEPTPPATAPAASALKHHVLHPHLDFLSPERPLSLPVGAGCYTGPAFPCVQHVLAAALAQRALCLPCCPQTHLRLACPPSLSLLPHKKLCPPPLVSGCMKVASSSSVGGVLW